MFDTARANGDLHFDVVGADAPKQYFTTLTKQTIAHAYLFSGPAGVGKKTFARRLAQSLLCQSSGEGVLGYDAACASCAMFPAGGAAHHPDFVEFDGSLRIGEAEGGRSFYDGEDLTSREIVRLFSLQAYAGGMRVLLLGDVEFASPSAANALLKFLEEAPKGIVAILTTPFPGNLLETIASRLIEVRFAPLALESVQTVLGNRGYDEARAMRGARLGGGSVARAVAAIERDEDSLRDAVARWFLDVARGETPVRTWATRETLEDGLEMLAALARDWVAVSLTAAQIPRAARDYAREIGELPQLNRIRASELLATFDDATRMSRTNVPPAMVAELARMAIWAGAGGELVRNL